MVMSDARWVESPTWETWRRTILASRFLNRYVKSNIPLYVSVLMTWCVNFSFFMFFTKGDEDNGGTLKLKRTSDDHLQCDGWTHYIYLIPVENGWSFLEGFLWFRSNFFGKLDFVCGVSSEFIDWWILTFLIIQLKNNIVMRIYSIRLFWQRS